jgi:predicted Zn-dependent protease
VAIRFFALCFWSVFLALSPQSSAQNLVLDEEFNQLSHQLVAPLRASLLPGIPVNFVLVADPAINAFVTADNLIYMHSGLVLQAKSASEIQGVLAHELGHLAAGHLQQRPEQGKAALIPMLAGAVLGVGAAAAGAPQAAVALALGGQAAGIQTMLGYSRVQESEADQRALQALHAAGLSGEGMADMFSTLRTQSQLSYDTPPAWLLTHPLSSERLARLTASVKEEKSAKQQELKVFNSNFPFARLQAKVAALTLTPSAVLRRYPGADANARYAQALALLRQGQLTRASRLLDTLLAEAPADPFYLELQGQIATQQGDLATAAAAYRKAVQQVPEALLIRYQLAEVLRAQGEDKAAMAHFRAITRSWPIWSEPWEGLGRTLGKLGALAQSHLAFAEAALSNGDKLAAKQSLALAESYLKKTTDSEGQRWAESLTERVK